MHDDLNDDAIRAISRLTNFGGIGKGDIAVLKSLATALRSCGKGDVIRAESGSPERLHLLLDGWAASAVTVANGSRQLVNVSLPGDFLGLPGLAIVQPIDEIVALTDVTVCDIAIDRFGDLFLESPRLAALIFLVSQEERAMAMERLALMGQSLARTRLAALFVRLRERLVPDDDAAAPRFFMPLTQRELGELIGVTEVHLNSLVKAFRDEGILTIRNREIDILDYRRLLDISGVSPWRRSRPTWLPAR